jgi:hypothetical protein
VFVLDLTGGLALTYVFVHYHAFNMDPSRVEKKKNHKFFKNFCLGRAPTF